MDAMRVPRASGRAVGEGQHHYLNVRNVEEEGLIEVHSSTRRHNLDRIPRLPERRAQADEFRMPDREHHIAAPYRVGAGEDGIGRHLREAFVYNVLSVSPPPSVKGLWRRYSRRAIATKTRLQAGRLESGDGVA